ncbi:MAG: hypothetical protein ABIF77_16225 [bacterium]
MFLKGLSLRSLGNRRWLPPLWGLTAALVMALGAGCTSEQSNLVGAGLHEARYDSLHLLKILDFDDFGNLEIEDIPFTQNRVLYIGRQGDERSAILVRYDFETWLDTIQADTDTSNIKRFNLILYFPNHYNNLRALDGTTITKVFQIQNLAAPLDSTVYPGDRPAVEPELINATPNDTIDINSPQTIPLRPEVLLGWYASHNGIMISEDEDLSVDEGLMGVASNEFDFAGSQLELDDDDTTVGVVLQIEFKEPAGYTDVLRPAVDLSTWDHIAPAPDDPSEGIVLRTHLRSYPYLDFDLSTLPENVLINRAVLGVYNDTTRSYGPLTNIICAEIDSSFVASVVDSVTLDDLGDAVASVTGRTSLDPYHLQRLEFNITRSLQRVVNGVFEDPIRYILCAAEDFFPTYDVSSVDPDFQLARFHFFGTTALDTLRPYLDITYTRIDELTEGGE